MHIHKFSVKIKIASKDKYIKLPSRTITINSRKNKLIKILMVYGVEMHFDRKVGRQAGKGTRPRHGRGEKRAGEPDRRPDRKSVV